MNLDTHQIIYSTDKSEQDILAFLEKANSSFNPKLSDKVDLIVYSKKIYKYANIIFAKLEDIDIGMVAFYINHETKIGFITLIGVLPEYQGRGIGKILLYQTLDCALKNNIDSIELEVSCFNTSAISFYKKNGFLISTSLKHTNNDNSLYMSKKLSTIPRKDGRTMN